MAKVVAGEQKIVAEPWWRKGQIIYIGLGVGLFWWILTFLLENYVVEPLACRDLATASACVNSSGIAGSIAAVLVAIGGTAALVRALQPRPIIIAVTSAILLWDMGSLLSGVSWWESLLWSLFMYTVAYVLFSLVSRYRWLAVSLLVALAVIAVIRLLLML